MPLLYYDDVFLQHDTGRHPECAERLRAIRRHLEACGLWTPRVRPATREATVDQLALVHARGMIDRVQRMSAQEGALDADTPVSPGSYPAARRAVGALLDACDRVLAGEAPSALCLVRPPGHHATPSRAMGFCLFNNVAIAARYLRERHGIDRLAIVDWDVHHGNGTQEAFWRDPGVFFLSLHRYPFYPGSGSLDEQGEDEGRGTTLNLPLADGTPREAYLTLFREALEGPVADYEPGFILVSAGFDAHRDDPVGGLGLEVEDFAEMTRIVAGVARQPGCRGVVSSLEGGYDLRVLPRCVEAHLRELP